MVTISVYAATTIGANIETAGTLTVTGASTFTGLATFDHATSTSATTTDYLYIGPDFTEDSNMNFTAGDLFVANDVNVGGVTYLDGALQATSTSLFTGAASFYSTLNVTGLATFDHATSTSATTTDYLYIGPDGVEGTFDFSGGDLYVADDVEIGGLATTTEALNTQGTLHVGGNADVDGTFDIGGGNTITKFMFGTCNIAATTVNASSTAYAECASATGVASGDNIFVTATSSLPENFIIQAASSTISNEISLRIYNTGSIEGTSTGVRTFFWQAIR
ncbi:hypothetical protein KKB98_03315 [Patescibacteria group bacterium]|nr:hypothetical protein [Patescibacteria group bacterium]